MIHIEKDQAIPENKDLRVFSASGDYSDNDLIECYDIKEPGLPVSSLQAQFIKYGGIVYQHNTPEELGAALVKVDPNSTHDSAVLFKEDEVRRLKRMTGTLEPQNTVPADPQISQIAQEQVIEQKNIPENTQTTQSTSTSTPSTTTSTIPESINTSTSSHATTTNTSTTTTNTAPVEILEPTATSTASSTPAEIPATAATSTDPIIDTPITSTSTAPVESPATVPETIPEVIAEKTVADEVIDAIESISNSMPTSTASN